VLNLSPPIIIEDFRLRFTSAPSLVHWEITDYKSTGPSDLITKPIRVERGCIPWNWRGMPICQAPVWKPFWKRPRPVLSAGFGGSVQTKGFCRRVISVLFQGKHPPAVWGFYNKKQR